jgi:hypothetical protein
VDTLPCYRQPRGAARVHLRLPRRSRHIVSAGHIVRGYMFFSEKIWDFNKKYLPFS